MSFGKSVTGRGTSQYARGLLPAEAAAQELLDDPGRPVRKGKHGETLGGVSFKELDAETIAGLPTLLTVTRPGTGRVVNQLRTMEYVTARVTARTTQRGGEMDESFQPLYPGIPFWCV